MKKVLGIPPTEQENLNKRKKISVRIPEKMLLDIKAAMSKEGLHQKQRSFWISSALLYLKRFPDPISLILEEWIEAGNNQPIQVTLTTEANAFLERLLEQIKTTKAAVKDPISSIIRTAIIQYLLWNTGVRSPDTSIFEEFQEHENVENSS